MPGWVQWAPVAGAVVGGIALFFVLRHQRWQRRQHADQQEEQRRQQAALQDERVEIKHPFWIKGWSGWLHVEVVNVGQCPVFIRSVKLHGPSMQQPMVFDTVEPQASKRAMEPGSGRFYERGPRQAVESLVKSFDGTWITAESAHGELARLVIDPARLAGPSEGVA